MRLLNRSTLISTLLLLLALVISGLYIYDQVSEEVHDEIDEELLNRKLEILAGVQSQTVVENPPLYAGFTIEPISKREYKHLKEHFEDIELYELIEKEHEPHRQLVTKFKHRDQYYRLRIEASLLDLEDMGEVIAYSTAWVCAALVLLGFLVNFLLQKRLWRPFYQTLDQLKHFRVDQPDALHLPTSTILEFQELTQVVSTLAEVNRRSYQQQKQFVENASHEIQTPLAIALHQAEELIQNPDLQEKDARALGLLTEQLERLSALNKALLLMTKISNQQYADVENVAVAPIVRRLVGEYEYLSEEKELQLDLQLDETMQVRANVHLIEILVRNLVRNAMLHATENGSVQIHVSDQKLSIANTARPITGKTEALFERFVKESPQRQSLGLGLAIVKSICEAYHYTPVIETTDHQFQITIQFIPDSFQKDSGAL
ncbi:hypothetical protein BWI97_11440 [Siphonobacter sp. BAB-5405]|uniref:sensor histidine kinase n=1 Tax=Siphonobacter sp. BAB-5405 TaxID=1864825 RepID=UPI000C8089DB|nr:HAMP domain-containing sensor histidine kinase [Siphonobacter sp. BAB-5405]PMD96774.1 hypothetical protein BWI97_11440 [Siphonobacter sp. BAB-5405]